MINLQRLNGGRNSQVYKVICNDSGPYVAKFYYSHQSDNRDRLKAEYKGLQFLWENNIRCIPRPIAADIEKRCAVYSYIDGDKADVNQLNESDIDWAVQFLSQLKQLRDRKESSALQPASEAFYAVNKIVGNIQSRFQRLSAESNNGHNSRELENFLNFQFHPFFDHLIDWCKSRLIKVGISFDSELSPEYRTLSPSDFGFHNAVRQGDGRIIFLDFEYFGWDDPAKMISDFLLHPAMSLNQLLLNRFFDKILECFKDDNLLDKRIEIVYPLFGLKWCMILLNEFLPSSMKRREFANKDKMNAARTRAVQLSKAKKMFDKMVTEYECFPYSN